MAIRNMVCVVEAIFGNTSGCRMKDFPVPFNAATLLCIVFNEKKVYTLPRIRTRTCKLVGLPMMDSKTLICSYVRIMSEIWTSNACGTWIALDSLAVVVRCGQLSSSDLGIGTKFGSRNGWLSKSCSRGSACFSTFYQIWMYIVHRIQFFLQ